MQALRQAFFGRNYDPAGGLSGRLLLLGRAAVLGASILQQKAEIYGLEVYGLLFNLKRLVVAPFFHGGRRRYALQRPCKTYEFLQLFTVRTAT